jgi:predicted transcriptional regulator
MASLAELTVQVLTVRMAKKEMTLEEIQKEMVSISTMIKAIDEGTLQEPTVIAAEPAAQKINFKQIFKKDEVICLICNKGFKTLKKHLKVSHSITDREYKKQFNIPAKQALIAKNYSDERKQAALERGQGDILAKARAARSAQKAAAAAPVKAVKASKPVKSTKAPAAAAKKAAKGTK